MITWRLCYVIATGCLLPNELSINYAHSFIGVYKVMHHGTLLITWHWRLPSVEGATCNLQTLSLRICRELVYHLATELSQSQAHAPGTVFPYKFTLPSRCTLMYSFKKLVKRFYFSVRILNLIRVLTLSGVLVSFFAYVALNSSFLHYVTLHWQGNWKTSRSVMIEECWDKWNSTISSKEVAKRCGLNMIQD